MKKVFLVIFTTLMIILLLVSSLILFNKFKNKQAIEQVYEILEENNIQETENTNSVVSFENKDTIGIIKIDKINFEGIIYDGTDLETLDKGVGHFKNSSYFDGNVCLAAHNSNEYWANLHTLQNGDKITYVSLLGTREYQVTNVTKISSTDWTLLQNTQENYLTLITCVKGKPSERLCVQALAVK